MTQRIRGILFDFDGTLAPNLDLPDMRRQVTALTKAHNVPEAVFKDHYIVEMIDVATQWLARKGQTLAERYNQLAHELITQFELNAARATTPFPQIPQYLEGLREAGIVTAVVTRNCRAAVLATYPNLLEQVDALLARDDTPHLKPDVRHLQRGLDALAIVPAQAAMVGDGQLDMRSGRALGLYCVGVLTGSADHATLSTAGAHEVVSDATAYEPTLAHD